MGYTMEPPAGVKTASILLYVGAAFSILGGIVIFSLLDGGIKAIGAVLILIGVAYIFLASRIRKGDRTARTIVVVLSAINILTALPGLPSTILTIVLSGLIIYFLQFQPEAKQFFGDT